ncbi:MAG: ethylbenzene dehydrogenase, partial [Anaerolineae bacterium]|nr:ethylbenzene dehydrogenase [Anaerolineae bacterium]
WMQLRDPENMGGDENVYYEDKFAFIWEINEIQYFAEEGCWAACHLSDDDDFGSDKPYGNKFTLNEDGLGDIWHWKSVRNLGQVHDQYLDSTMWSEETPSAGRHSDPSDGGGYSNNVDNSDEANVVPAFMPAGDDFPRDGSPGFIIAEEAVPFDASIFEPGDRIPGIVISQFEGDGGDISAGWVWEDGVWTLELGRALVTESEFDVQFDDLSAVYQFGVAPFDNAQVRHSTHRGPLDLVFEQ